MIVVPKQLLTSVCALDTKELGLDSNEFSQICEESLTWRGKDSQSRTWLQRWKRGDWIKHLCLRTLKPSHTESFVASWISSLAASRASPLVLLESVTELKTLDTCFHSLPRESDNADQKLFSSKTWKELSQQKQTTERAFSNMSSERWKTWITAQRQEYSQRVKSEHHTNESGFLSSAWRTPTTTEPGISVEKLQGKLDGSRAINKLTGRVGQYGLNQQVQKLWLTPRANDKGNGESQKTFLKRMNDRSKNCHQSLAAQVKNWPTPTTAEGTKIGNKANYGQIGLSNHPTIVGLPDREKLNKNGKNRGLWSTPLSRDWKGKGKEKDLPSQTEKAGKLNPSWVEQIMGIPVGWTALGSWGME